MFEALVIHRSERETVVTASFHGVPIWGAGPNIVTALRDLATTIEEHYKHLSEREAELAPHMRRELAALREAMGVIID